MSEFSYGVANRGASCRIPRTAEIDGYGYFEDRRPVSLSIHPTTYVTRNRSFIHSFMQSFIYSFIRSFHPFNSFNSFIFTHSPPPPPPPTHKTVVQLRFVRGHEDDCGDLLPLGTFSRGGRRHQGP